MSGPLHRYRSTAYLLFPLLLCATPSALLALMLGGGAADAAVPVQGVWGDAAGELGGHHHHHGRALLGKVVLAHVRLSVAYR